MAGQLNQLPSSLQPIAERGSLRLDVSPVWYKFFQSVASLYSSSGGSSGASALLDTIGTEIGGMLARFNTGWQEFVASAPGQIPVMSPGVQVTLRTFGQLLDAIGNVRGDILFRGAAGWQVLAPVAGGYLQSQGAGADPSYVAGTSSNSVATGLTAAGTTQGTALALTVNWNEITTVPPNSGVQLGALGVGQPSLVFSEGANPLNVYPPAGGTIDALAADAPYVLAAAKMQQFFQLTASRWRTAQLG